MHVALMIQVMICTIIQISMQVLLGAGEFDDLFGDACA